MDSQTPCTAKNIAKAGLKDLLCGVSSIKDHCPNDILTGLWASNNKLEYLEQHCNL